MKITQVDLYEVEVPLIRAIAARSPKIYDITICRMLTDEGIEGIGESAVYTLNDADRQALRAEADAYIGMDPLAMECSCLFAPVGS